MNLPEDDSTSGTGTLQVHRPGTFQKGDIRINRKGRPKTFDKLRKLAVEVAAEENAVGVSRILAMLRAMSISDNPADRRLFLEYTFGKVKDEADITSAGKAINFIVERTDDNEADSATPEPESVL